MTPLKHKIEIDMVKPGPKPLVNAVQNDVNSRAVEVTLLQNGAAYDALGIFDIAVAFKKPDGTSGLYDKLPNGDPAISVAGNTVTATFAPQMLTCTGKVEAAVVLIEPATLDRIATFPFTIMVTPDPSAGQSVSNNYYNFATLEKINEALNASGSVYYYTTLSEAVAAANGGTFDSKLNDGAVALRRIGSRWIADLNADCALSERLNISADVTLNLNGHALTMTTNEACLAFAAGTSCEINGGSTGKIVKKVTDGATSNVMCISANGNFSMNGGIYEMTGDLNTAGMACIMNGATSEKFSMTGCTVRVDNAGKGRVIAVYSVAANAVIRDCDISANSTKGICQAVANYGGKTEVRNCRIFADSGHNVIGEHNGIVSYAVGIDNNAEVHVYDSNVIGTHSGLQAYPGSKNYLAGGVYDSCSHGGVYVSTGANGVFHAVDATIKCGHYKGKNDSSQFNDYLGGFYIGGASDSVVYMDGCVISAEGGYGFILRGTGGETGVKLYISNSAVMSPDNSVRVDSAAHHLYVGTGTNITTDMAGVLEDRTSFTEETYRKLTGAASEIPMLAQMLARMEAQQPEGGNGDIDPEAIQDAVKEYLEENPVSVDPESIGAIPVPETAQVGQTLAVKAINEKGVPTEWETMDLPGGGGAEKLELLRAITIPADITTDESGVVWYACTAEGQETLPCRFAFHTDESGQPFAVSKFYIDVVRPNAASIAASAKLYLTTNDGQKSIDASCLNTTTETNRTGVCEWTPQYWHETGVLAGARTGSLLIRTPDVYDRSTFMDVKEVTGFDVTLNRNTSCWPSGTTIKFYGVRL